MAMDVKTMDIKKGTHTATSAAPVSNAKEEPSPGVKVFDFIGDVKEEFHKISWTSPDELRLHTKMVVGATFICGLGIYLVDLCIQNTLQLVAVLFHFIFG